MSMLNLYRAAHVGKHYEKVVLAPHRRTTSVYRRGGLLVLAAELQGHSESLAGVFVVDRENVILFATVLAVVREDYVDREATDTEK